jgi:hypothetical protein
MDPHKPWIRTNHGSAQTKKVHDSTQLIAAKAVEVVEKLAFIQKQIEIKEQKMSTRPAKIVFREP